MSEVKSAIERGAATAVIGRAGRLDVAELFRLQVRRRGAMTAIDADGRRLSYGELGDRVARLAAGLRRRGIGCGDRIAVLSENRPEYIELELAAAEIGAIVACQNWRLAGPELAHCIGLVAPKLVVVSPRFAAALAGVSRGDASVVELGADYEALLAGGVADQAPAGVDPEQGLVILYTSGTTGLPKGALISHRAEIARMAVLGLDYGFDEDDGFCAWAPMFHMASTDHMLAALMVGAPVVVVDGFQPARILDAVEKYRIGWLVLMPGAIEPVIAEARARAVAPRGIRVAGAMADLVPGHQLAEVTALLRTPYLNSFGSTETGLPPASRAVVAPGTVPASLSKRQSSLCDLRLVDADGNEVAEGEPGEAAVRGPTVFSGYWNAPETNARDFRDGWFRLGDLFRRNPDGSLDFVDRAKYMIKSGGENIYPAEIERVLLADPRITDAVVVRRRDAQWGEVPVAFVARNDPQLDEAAVEALCRRDLAGYKRPREVRFVDFDDLPRSTTGKIQRHEVEKWL